jgi:exopolyphosphatase/guanosine-5'-triphosphate,3'-diphosphate pyrophosphatase
LRRLAAIDIGTNTIRMLITERGGKRPVSVTRRRSIVGLGRCLRDTGRIGEAEFEAGLRVLREFGREMRHEGIGSYRACGTACLRDAENSAAFLKAAAADGLDIEVIGPAEEARLTWEGIRWAVAGRPGDLAMDIGGGSTEFAFGPGEDESVSLATGVVVLSTLLPLSDPPNPWELRAVSYYAAGRIEDGTRPFGRRRFRRLIGTAGTFTTLAAMERGMTRYNPDRINGARLSAGVVRRWTDRLGRMTDAQRLRVPGMEKGRERYVVPGVLLIVAAMERFRLNGVTVSDAGLLEGILAGVGDTGERADEKGNG